MDTEDTLRPSPRAALAGLWRDADRGLLTAGFFILAMVPVSVLLAVLDPRVLDGSNVWLKPMKFQASVAVFLLTLALALPLASDSVRRGPVGKGTAWLAIVTGGFEVMWISLRAGLGERSHYAFDSTLGGIMYGVMAIAALLLSCTPIIAAVSALVARSNAPGHGIIRWGFALGSGVALVGAAVIGVMLGGSPDHYPVSEPDAAARVPVAGWSVERGDLRIAHFVGIHAMQGVPLLALALIKAPPRTARVVLTVLAAVWLGGVFWLAREAIQGRSPLAPIGAWLGIAS